MSDTVLPVNVSEPLVPDCEPTSMPPPNEKEPVDEFLDTVLSRIVTVPTS